MQTGSRLKACQDNGNESSCWREGGPGSPRFAGSCRPRVLRGLGLSPAAGGQATRGDPERTTPLPSVPLLSSSPKNHMLLWADVLEVFTE